MKLNIKNKTSKGFGILAGCAMFASALAPSLTMADNAKTDTSNDPVETYEKTTRYHFADYQAINPTAHPDEDTLFTSGPWSNVDGIGYLSDSAKGLVSGWGYTDGHGLVEPDYFRTSTGKVAYCLNMSKKAPTGQIDKGDLLPIELKRVLINGYPYKHGSDYGNITDAELEWATAVATKIVEGNNYDPETGEVVGKGLTLEDFKNNKIVSYFYATTKEAYEKTLSTATTKLSENSTKLADAQKTLVNATKTLEDAEKQLEEYKKDDTLTEEFVNNYIAYVESLKEYKTGAQTSVTFYENAKTTYEKQISDSNTVLTKIADSENKADELYKVVETLVNYSNDESVTTHSFTLDKTSVKSETTPNGYLVGPYKVSSDYEKEIVLTLSNHSKGTKIVDKNGKEINGFDGSEQLNEFYVQVPLTTTASTIKFNVRAEVKDAKDIVSHVYVPTNKNEQTMAVVDEVAVVDTVEYSAPVRSVEITKTDLTTSAPVPGATIEIKNANNEVIYTSTTDTNGKLVPIKLTAGTYTFTETVAPDGYILSKESFTFTISEDGKVTGTTEITNTPTEIVITKTDLTTGEPLQGAVIEIKDSNGKVVFKDVTDTNGQIRATKLPVGEYTFVETVAPDGYIVSQETFKFTINSDGTIVGDTDITNKQTLVELKKVDEDTNEPVQGAVIEVYNKNGESVYKGETDVNGMITILKLPIGTYTYKELEAPNGYILSDRTYEFTIEADGTVTGDVLITNTKIPPEPVKPEEPTPNEPQEPNNDQPSETIQTAVNTVKENAPLVGLGLLVVAGVCAGAVIKNRKKESK